MPWLLTPRWLALHVALVAAVAGAVLLGRWQMEAYVARDERDREVEAEQAAADPRPLGTVVAPGEALTQPAVGRPVETAGRYDPAETLLLPGRELDGQIGWFVVTPLVDDTGAVTPVLRGWVDDPGSPATDAPGGALAVTGVVAALETDADAAVDARTALPDGQVPALTAPTVFREYGYPPAQVRQMLLVAADETPEPAAAPQRATLDQVAPEPSGISAWRHLSYAWQWWLFGAAAVVFWGAFVRAGFRERRDERGQQVAPPDEPSPTHPGRA